MSKFPCPNPKQNALISGAIVAQLPMVRNAPLMNMLSTGAAFAAGGVMLPRIYAAATSGSTDAWVQAFNFVQMFDEVWTKGFQADAPCMAFYGWAGGYGSVAVGNLLQGGRMPSLRQYNPLKLRK